MSAGDVYYLEQRMDGTKMSLSDDKTAKVYELQISDPNYEQHATVEACKPTGFMGLTQSELEKYANDPTWKVFRRTMFVLFWIIWLLMFLGAILLIVFGPKCAVVKEPEWWRKQVSYQIFTPTFYDHDNDAIGDFHGIREKLYYLKKIGMSTIWVTPVIDVEKDDFVPYAVIDFDSVDERFGTIHELKLLINATHDLSMHFTMDLPIAMTSVSHKWFKSASASGDYFNYYVWKKAEDVKKDPNYVVEKGKDMGYLVYEGKYPVLNWANPAVQESISTVARSFLNIGVDGFHVDRIGHLFKHLSKPERKDALSMIDKFTTSIREYGRHHDREIVISSSLNDFVEMQEFINPALLNFSYFADVSVTKLDKSCPGGVAQCLHSTLTQSSERFNTTKLPYAWQFTNYYTSRLRTRFDKATASLLTFVQLSLPGAIEISYGQELNLDDSNSTSKFTGLMQWDSSEYAGFTAVKQKPSFSTTTNYKEDNYQVQYSASHSQLKTVRAVTRMRQFDNDFALGEIRLAPLTQDVILFSRFHEANGTTGTVYLIAANFGTTETEIKATTVLPDTYIEAHAEIAIVTETTNKYRPREKISSLDKISLGPKQGVIIKVHR